MDEMVEYERARGGIARDNPGRARTTCCDGEVEVAAHGSIRGTSNETSVHIWGSSKEGTWQRAFGQSVEDVVRNGNEPGENRFGFGCYPSIGCRHSEADN